MYHWSIVEAAAESDLSLLTDGVIKYGRSLASDGDARPIACFVRDNHRIISGASGQTEYSRLFISYLWVAEGLRSIGLGTQILEKIEFAAAKRRSADALVETLNDRAATLYARLGYQTIAEIPCFVGFFTKYIMIKNLV